MHVHLLGIAGTGMTGLAQLLVDQGHRVTGSDAARIYPPMSEVLARLAVPVAEGYQAVNLEPRPDLVVVGNAIGRGNPELEEALDLGLAYTSMAEAIEDLVLPGRLPVVVAGTHGKTTTTAAITWILRQAGRDPGWLVGGLPRDLPSTATLGGGREFVIEGDEYDTAYFDKRAKFHHYRPRVLVILNLEYDHADIYPDLASIVTEFKRLVNTVPRSGLIVAAAASAAVDEVVARAHAPVVRFGFEADSDYRAQDLRWDGLLSFGVSSPRDGKAAARLGLAGRFNALNATAALAVADHLGVPRELSLKSLAEFRGVARRLERRGEERGVTVWDDFAHHPTAIRGGIEAIRETTGQRVWAVLEPRSWSMRLNTHQEALAPALAEADFVVLAPVFEPEKIAKDKRLDSAMLLASIHQRGRGAWVIDGVEAMARFISERALPGDQVLVMSNGGFGGLHGLLLDRLRGAG